MNKRDFFKWLDSQECGIKPKEGINNTAGGFEAFKKSNPSIYCYFFLSPHSENVSSHTIENCILKLGIQAPKAI